MGRQAAVAWALPEAHPYAPQRPTCVLTLPWPPPPGAGQGRELLVVGSGVRLHCLFTFTPEVKAGHVLCMQETRHLFLTSPLGEKTKWKRGREHSSYAQQGATLGLGGQR